MGSGQQPVPHVHGDSSPEPAPALSPFPIAESALSSWSRGTDSWELGRGAGHRQPAAGADTHLLASGDGHFLEFAVAVSGVGADGQTWKEGERTGQATVQPTHHTGVLTEHPPAPTATPPVPKPATACPGAPGPAALWPAASVQVAAWAWRDLYSELCTSQPLLQLSSSHTGSPTLARPSARGRSALAAWAHTRARVLAPAALLELRGSHTHGPGNSCIAISATQHAEPGSCQPRFQTVLSKLFMIQDLQSWARTEAAAGKGVRGRGGSPSTSELRAQESCGQGLGSLTPHSPAEASPCSACSLLPPSLAL